MDSTMNFIGDISAVVTLVAFIISIVWNHQSNKQVRKSNFIVYKKFAESIISIRKMKIERAEIEIQRLTSEAESHKIIRDLKVNHTDSDSEKEIIIKEYSQRINDLSVTAMKLQQLVTQWGLDAVKDYDSFIMEMKKIKK